MVSINLCYIIFTYFQFISLGTTINGVEETLPGETTTVTQVTTVTVSEITENAPVNETVTPAEETIQTTTTTTIEEITTVTVQGEPSTTNTDENVPTEASTDGMDTSE